MKLGFELLRQAGESVGRPEPNLHAFCHNNPNDFFDADGLKDRKWPFNGRVKVHKKCPRSVRAVDVDNKRIYIVGPGQSSPRDVDVDYVEVEGKWYKIGIWTFDVDCNCKSDDGFREATPDELKVIQEVLDGEKK